MKHLIISIYLYTDNMHVEDTGLEYCWLIIKVASYLEMESCQMLLSRLSSGKNIAWL